MRTFKVVLHNINQVLLLNGIAPAPCDFQCWIAGNPRDGGTAAGFIARNFDMVTLGSLYPGVPYNNPGQLVWVPKDGDMVTFDYDAMVNSPWYGGMVSMGGRIYGQRGAWPDNWSAEVIACSSWFKPLPDTTFDWDVLTAAVSVQGADVVIEPPSYPNPTPVTPETTPVPPATEPIPAPTPIPQPTPPSMPTPAPAPTRKSDSTVLILALIAIIVVAFIVPGK